MGGLSETLTEDTTMTRSHDATYFPDLSPRVSPDVSGIRVLAVGWLGPDTEFVTGDLDAPFLLRLFAVATRFCTLADRSYGGCPICGASYSDGPVYPEKLAISFPGPGIGSYHFCKSEIWIKESDDTYWSAPDLILHHMVFHRYQPPERFKRAVLAINGRERWEADELAERCGVEWRASYGDGPFAPR